MTTAFNANDSIVVDFQSVRSTNEPVTVSTMTTTTYTNAPVSASTMTTPTCNDGTINRMLVNYTVITILVSLLLLLI